MVEDLLPFPDNNVKQGQKQYTGTATNRDKPKLANLRILRIYLELKISIFSLLTSKIKQLEAGKFLPVGCCSGARTRRD